MLILRLMLFALYEAVVLFSVIMNYSLAITICFWITAAIVLLRNMGSYDKMLMVMLQSKYIYVFDFFPGAVVMGVAAGFAVYRELFLEATVFALYTVVSLRLMHKMYQFKRITMDG